MKASIKYLVYLCLVTPLYADAPLATGELQEDLASIEVETSAPWKEELTENLHTSYDIIKDNVPSLKTIAIGTGTVLTGRKLYSLLKERMSIETPVMSKVESKLHSPNIGELVGLSFVAIVAMVGIVYQFKRHLELKDPLRSIKKQYIKLQDESSYHDEESYTHALATLLIDVRTYWEDIRTPKVSLYDDKREALKINLLKLKTQLEQVIQNGGFIDSLPLVLELVED